MTDLDEWILRYEADQQLHLFTSRFYSVTTIRYDWWQQTSAAWRLGYARLVGSGQIRRTACVSVDAFNTYRF